MGKTIHVVSNAAGVILKASKDEARCLAFIEARADETTMRIMEKTFTPSGDPVTLFKDFRTDKIDHGEGHTELKSDYHVSYALTTVRLS